MDCLKWVIAAWAATLSAAAGADPVNQWESYIGEASARFAVPEDWIRRVMRAESGGRTRLHGRPITSRAGAMGLMQLMPGTWAEMRRVHRLGRDPHDPRDNILAGTAYLRLMYERFGYPGLFAAYNAGPARYAAHLRSGRPLPAETLSYVNAVAGSVGSAERRGLPGPDTARADGAASLFAIAPLVGSAQVKIETLEHPAGAAIFIPVRRARVREAQADLSFDQD